MASPFSWVKRWHVQTELYIIIIYLNVLINFEIVNIDKVNSQLIAVKWNFCCVKITFIICISLDLLLPAIWTFKLKYSVLLWNMYIVYTLYILLIFNKWKICYFLDSYSYSNFIRPLFHWASNLYTNSVEHWLSKNMHPARLLLWNIIFT